MSKPLSRRKVLGMAAGAAATAVPALRWVFAVGGDGAIVKAAAKAGGGEWKPLFFSRRRADAVAALAETIVPRTDTPGARDARVHEFIDLELSLLEGAAPKRFLEGLDWIEARCKKEYGTRVAKAAAAELEELLTAVSDLHETHAEGLEPGVRFFKDLKRRTLFAYYTSQEGRVELGLPKGPAMGRFRGCGHEGEDHASVGPA